MDPVPPPHGAGKWAQLLGETIVHHAPWTSEIAERTKRRITDEWLDGLEAHTASFTGPIMQMVLDNSDPPEPVANLLREIINPTAAFSSTLEQIFVFGIASTIIGASLQPFLQEVTNSLSTAAVDAGIVRPIDPAQLVTLAVRGLSTDSEPTNPVSGAIYEEAAKSGVGASDMAAMIAAAGQPPSPQDLFEMLRRSIIDEDGVKQGLMQGDTKDSWIDNFIKLAYTTPTPIDLVRAAVQNQMDYPTANAIAITLGLEPPGYVKDNPDWFKLLFDIAGRPPGPEEVGRMANRGIVEWAGTGAGVTSFAQAIAESDIKTKWTSALEAIQAHYPTAGESVTLYQAGAITEDQLTQYLKGNGVDETLIKAYEYHATTQEIAQDRALAKGDILTALYDGIISNADALDLLGDVGYFGKTASDLVQITNMRREIREINKAVRRVGSQYVGFKITGTDAKESLSALGIPDDQASQLLAIWETERKPETRLPSVEQLAKAVQYSGLPFESAVSAAELLGYTQFDATLVIAAGSESAPPGNVWPPNTDTGVQV